MPRSDRAADELRPFSITRGFTKWAEGSVLVTAGDTKVICTASVEDKVPAFLAGTGRGWVTAEYSLLPRATKSRTAREASKGKVSGRTSEIQRLIGRALRSVTDLDRLGERTIWLDCDVIQADGGTRTAAISGAFVALAEALNRLRQAEGWEDLPLSEHVAAVSVGLVDGERLLDLDYEEDSRAQVDMNVVMTGSGKLVEIQGTAEQAPFSREDMLELLDLASSGIQRIIALQRDVLGEIADFIGGLPCGS